MDAKLFDRLSDYCERSGQTKTVAIERALAMYIDDYDNKMEMLASMVVDRKLYGYNRHTATENNTFLPIAK